MVEIVFLGTGGGRINLLKQIRGTGGFRINSESANIHVDPGPGALLHSLRLNQDPLKLDVVIVTHNHMDHVNDANLFVEAMSHYTLKKKGILVGSRHALEGDKIGDRGVTSYHQQKAGQVYVARWGEKKTFKTGRGEFEIEIIKTRHDEPTSFGFKLVIDGRVIGYTTDTELFEGIGNAYSGCDCLIVNCLKPKPDRYKGHLTTRDTIEIVKVARPRIAVISHLGMRMMGKNADLEAQKVETATGIRCMAAVDGKILKL